MELKCPNGCIIPLLEDTLNSVFSLTCVTSLYPGQRHLRSPWHDSIDKPFILAHRRPTVETEEHMKLCGICIVWVNTKRNTGQGYIHNLAADDGIHINSLLLYHRL